LKQQLLKNYVFKKKFFIILFIAILIMLISFSIFTYNLVDKEYDKHINEKLRSAALNTAFVLGDDFFDKASRGEIYTDEDIDDTFKLTKLAQNEGVDYIYSMMEKNGKIYFTSSSATKGEIRSNKIFNYMEEYPEATDKLKNIFKTFNPFYEVSTDRWGTFKSILIPMQTKKGVKYIVGADIRIDKILRAKENFLKKIILINILFVLMMIYFAYKTRKLLKKEIDVIDNIQNKLEKEIEEKTKELTALNKNLQKRVEEEVAKSREKDKKLIISSRLSQMGEAIYMITHQWQQPLNSISLMVGYLKLLKESDDLSIDEIEKCIIEANERINYLADTMKNFKSFFKNDKEKEEVYINSLVEDVVKILAVILKNKNIEIKTEFKSREKVKVYKNEVMQVIMDLIKNAVDEIEKRDIKNGIIKIITEGKKIIVEDNAGGINEDIKDKIFDFHFTTKENGTGLGLYMSKIIINEHHKGSLEVENGDKGARFIINFASTQ